MSNHKQITLPITGMTCANCVSTVERNLKKVNGVDAAMVNSPRMNPYVRTDGWDDEVAKINAKKQIA